MQHKELKQFIGRHVARLMKRTGFKAVKSGYLRQHGETDQAMFVQSLVKPDFGHYWFRLYVYASTPRLCRLVCQDAIESGMPFEYDPMYGPLACMLWQMCPAVPSYHDVYDEGSSCAAIQIIETALEGCVLPILDSIRSERDVVESVLQNPQWTPMSHERINEVVEAWHATNGHT